MKRKTNLFYTAGEDSKFLTFSNYTEALTGNFLSTNIKVLPSSFLCLNIPNLTLDNKENFIKTTLIASYENKLAVLRDADYTNIDELGILMEYIHEFVNTEERVLITAWGNITEQDYNGTFTDIICVIDSSKINTLNYNINVGSKLCVDNDPGKLHGWYNGDEYTGPSVYQNLVPTYDNGEDSYYVDTTISIETNETTQSNVTFNVIIPLFNVYNIDTEELIDSNIPLGIWFADNTIELTYDGKFGQTWSLAIGSQFKPLPTMDKSISDVTDDSNKLAYSTFARVLSRQNALLNTFEELSKQIISMQNQINDLYSIVKNQK